MNRKEHWNRVYETKSPEQASWFQTEAKRSFDFIRLLSPAYESRILDVGVGTSVLIDQLIEAGYRNLTVLDVSKVALALLHSRLQARFKSVAGTIKWIESDVLVASIESRSVDVWHDRAVFHFLTDATERELYKQQVQRALVSGGIAVFATFAEDGPSKCSGLETMRYSPESLSDELGDDFQLIKTERDLHLTPSSATQAFTYCAFRYSAPVSVVSPATK